MQKLFIVHTNFKIEIFTWLTPNHRYFVIPKTIRHSQQLNYTKNKTLTHQTVKLDQTICIFSFDHNF